MSEHVEISTSGVLGIVTLNRPTAINALSQQMIDEIGAALLQWEADPAIGAVLLEGRGERGFCSGGDVRAARTAILEDRKDLADAFFASEYALDARVSRYPKPVIALTHGVVMGGGIGLAGHASFRFTTRSSKFAMPEGGIGFVPDCGVCFILAKALPERALHFLLRGEAVRPADAMKLGLTDCVVADERIANVREWIITAAQASDLETAMTSIMQTEMVECGPPVEMDVADRLAGAYAGSTALEIVKTLTEMAQDSDDAARALAVIRRRCPTSLAAAVESYRAAWLAMDVREVTDRDTRLAQWIARRPDFAEGVRAVLVDRDHQPKWSPQSLDQVELGLVKALVRGNRAGAGGKAY